MRNHILTLAAASLVSGAAFAQSGPTVYGVADLVVESVSATGATAPGVDIPSRLRLSANSSLLGVKGKVAIGGSTSVIYQFETYVDLGNNQVTVENTPIVTDGKTVAVGGLAGAGSGNVFGPRRDTFLGLTGNWGTVKAGYLSTGFRGTTAKYDLAPGATGVTTSYNVFGLAAPGKSFFARTPSIMYNTPTVNGFSGGINYIPNSAKAATGDVNPGGWDLMARFETKTFSVSVVHTDLKDLLWGGYASESNKSDAVFASYAFPTKTTVVGMYNAYSGTLVDATTKKGFDIKQNSFYFGIKQVWGLHELMLNFVSAPSRSGSGLPASLPAADSAAKQLALRYGYNVFKNTQIYVSYSAISNEANVNYNYQVGSIGGSTGATVAKGADPNAIGFGMRFTF